MSSGWVIAAAAFLAGIAGWFWFLRSTPKTSPSTMRIGQPLPRFTAESESGEPLSSESLRGQRCVILFVRGSWCPFCTEQVESLTNHYRSITESGGRLIIMTPKPLDTTRRVAELFNVSFEFWLDASLRAAETLGLADPEDIPGRFQENFGKKTMRPAVAVVDEDTVVRFLHVAKNTKDRPSPDQFIGAFEHLSKT
ncbi:MAG: redoxin domain-containing protein [Pseudomonadota bacterium]